VKAEQIADKLGIIFHEVDQLVEAHRPDELSVEQVFMARNAASALKLGHARGAAICAVVKYHLPVSEYSPRTIKQAIVGSGAAGKEQVQHMVRHILGIHDALQADAADALAVALCHAHTISTLKRLPAGLRWRSRR
jgi:crossover junction endodeoxyribonuclease RuvC